ncbi:MAG: nicotinate (nicotinamide) nucleotide adenylyltransferase [Bacteroidales bacterium]|nr:nicotinate (nicotinamide) nucleotide adenylyltransferase [Bacteroidales bacterium]
MPLVVHYFGSFNPVHEGHLGIMRFVSSMEEVDTLEVIVSPHNPFKDKNSLADAGERLDALRKATAGIAKLRVNDIEFSLTPPLYTINTLRELRKAEPGSRHVLLIGADNIASLHCWHKADELLKEFEIWVYPRPGYNPEPEFSRLAETGARLRLLDGVQLYDISSTRIREMQAAQRL